MDLLLSCKELEQGHAMPDGSSILCREFRDLLEMYGCKCVGLSEGSFVYQNPPSG